MTLAVATIHGDEVFLLADLQLSYELDTNVDDRPNTALKIFFLSKYVAVAYAGTTEIAHNVIREAVSRATSLDVYDIADFLREKCREHTDIEFLLMNAQPPAAIYKVNSRIFASATHGQYWIGASEAADVLFAGSVINPFSLETRFQSLLDSRKFPGVGSIVTSAKAANGLVKFQPKLILTSPYYVPQAKSDTVDFGDAARGGFGYTTLTPCEPDQNGWGSIFFRGFSGISLK
jgi:hypothetical protein